MTNSEKSDNSTFASSWTAEFPLVSFTKCSKARWLGTSADFHELLSFVTVLRLTIKRKGELPHDRRSKSRIKPALPLSQRQPVESCRVSIVVISAFMNEPTIRRLRGARGHAAMPPCRFVAVTRVRPPDAAGTSRCRPARTCVNLDRGRYVRPHSVYPYMALRKVDIT